MRALRRVGDEVLDAHAQPLLLRGVPDLELDAALAVTADALITLSDETGGAAEEA
jgi:hypothetical protein